jgi:hypothetical protein
MVICLSFFMATSLRWVTGRKNGGIKATTKLYYSYDVTKVRGIVNGFSGGRGFLFFQRADPGPAQKGADHIIEEVGWDEGGPDEGPADEETADELKKRGMEELEDFKDGSGDEDAEGDFPGGGFSREKEHHQTPENLIQNPAEGIVDPGAAGAGVEFGGEAEWGDEEEGDQNAKFAKVLNKLQAFDNNQFQNQATSESGTSECRLLQGIVSEAVSEHNPTFQDLVQFFATLLNRVCIGEYAPPTVDFSKTRLVLYNLAMRPLHCRIDIIGQHTAFFMQQTLQIHTQEPPWFS